MSAWVTVVHPRVCGELTLSWKHCAHWDGSSPRVWGTRNAAGPSSQISRFIPACVENSDRQGIKMNKNTVHPRVCGELFGCLGCNPIPCGSSPRVWGTPFRFSRQLSLERFIPACVGNSTRARDLSGDILVHPRVCGELDPEEDGVNNLPGSSPRVWGTRGPRRAVPRSARFIPACVGNSRSVAGAATAMTVHPRVCGELVPVQAVTSITYGSSPRVWGTLELQWLTLRTARGSSPRVWGTLPVAPC